MRLLVAENDTRVRSALVMLFKQQLNYMVAECDNMGSLVEQIRSFKPDLVLLDWELPGRPSSALLFTLNNHSTKPKVIALSRWPETESAALAAGADAFLCKSDAPELLLAAIDQLDINHYAY